jgi:transposase
LRQADLVEPRAAPRHVATVLDGFRETLAGWLKTNRHRGKRERRSLKTMYHELVAMGYRGGYGRVAAFSRTFYAEESQGGTAYVPLKFALGEAFQFDWSTEYPFVGGLRRQVQAAHTKLCASRAFFLSAYPTQSHEMLFDAHARAFAAFHGITGKGIYDNPKTIVDRVGRGKVRTVNARFEAMCSHYLFEPEFCNVAAGWEKGIVEKNVQDRRRHIWLEAQQRRWAHWDELNEWLAQQCRAAWVEMKHPEWPDLAIEDVLEQERTKLMPCPKPFDGYVEYPVRVTSTALVHLERNRYSVPTRYAHRVLSLRVYPMRIEVVADAEKVAGHERSFERDRTIYDWRHYIEILQTKPGALRNGAPFETMPEPLRKLQRHLLTHPGGDRAMAQLLAAVTVHGLEAILQATEAALAVGKPSAEHVVYLTAQLKERGQLPPARVESALVLREEPRADVDRYEQLRLPPALGAFLLASVGPGAVRMRRRPCPLNSPTRSRRSSSTAWPVACPSCWPSPGTASSSPRPSSGT